MKLFILFSLLLSLSLVKVSVENNEKAKDTDEQDSETTNVVILNDDGEINVNTGYLFKIFFIKFFNFKSQRI